MREQQPHFTAEDHRWMAHAHRLAAKGLFTTDPNPRVGCVLVKAGEKVGEGYHIEAGGPHAEIHALQDAGSAAEGATAYVTLEPCSHYGRTPPCCDTLIAAKVSRVVIALEDPNPAVSGNGIRKLQAAGIEVSSGLLGEETERLNPGFLKRMRSGTPYLRLKMAQSLDGRTAMASGESQWITGPAARKDVQRLRARSSAILTGIGTVLADDPSLNVRELEQPFRTPLRIVVDPSAKTPADAKLFTIDGPILMVVAEGAVVPAAWKAVTSLTVMSVPRTKQGIDLAQLMQQLGAEGINEIHVEVGATLAGSLVDAALVDELVVYTAPLLMGSSGRPLLQLPLEKMAEKKRLHVVDQRTVGEDWRLVALIQS